MRLKYDRQENKIKLGVSEFVSIAKRGISPTLPYDEEEGNAPPLSVRTLSLIRGRPIRAERLALSAKLFEYDFEISGEVLFDREGEIIIAREVSEPKRPSKEEIKLTRGEGFILAHIYADLVKKSQVKITFLYTNPLSEETNELSETVGASKLSSFFSKCLTAVSVFARPEVERVTKRLISFKSVKFPYKSIREGQSEFVRAAYRTISRGGRLYAGAPTGTGKTVSAIFPAIRALGDERIDKVFYLTPKTTTARAAEDCLRLLSEGGAVIRSVTLCAKARLCENGLVCRRSKKECKNSRQNALARATLELYDEGRTIVGMSEIRECARRNSVCPYELSFSYSELCDIVICDFNYLFDKYVYIRRFFDRGGRYAFLVDEAHNLDSRVREGYSASLSEAELSLPLREELLSPLSKTVTALPEVLERFSEILYPYLKEEIRETKNGKKEGAAHTRSLPGELLPLFSRLVRTAEEEISAELMARDEEAPRRLEFLRGYLKTVKNFRDILEIFNESFEMFIFFDDGRISAKLYCLDPSGIIKERLDKGHSALLFSATLSPLSYYRSILGGDRSDDILEVKSPFDESQLSVIIMDKISTRYSERDKTLSGVIRAIAATVSARRGNYMVFSPSFAYSEALCEAFRKKYPKLKVLMQKSDMTDKEKREFLTEFEKEDSSYLIAFCVMGGIYAEGIDLAGERLIGAVVVGVGMPTLSFEREAISAYFEEKYEQGKQYAYIYPGINRVLQAAGRVIRREEDRGVIVLLDDRFDDPIYKKSLPELWGGVKFLGDAKALKEELEEFWRGDIKS